MPAAESPIGRRISRRVTGDTGTTPTYRTTPAAARSIPGLAVSLPEDDQAITRRSNGEAGRATTRWVDG